MHIPRFSPFIVNDFFHHGLLCDRVEDLERFFLRMRDQTKAAIAHYVARHFSDRRPAVIFGAGIVGRLVLDAFRENGITAECFCDNNPALHGSAVGGLKVAPPAALKNLDRPRVITAAGNEGRSGRIRDQLRQMNINGLEICSPYHDGNSGFGDLPRLAAHIDDLLPHMDEIAQVCSMLDDERSKLVYLSALKAVALYPLTDSGFVSFPLCESDQYWALPPFRDNAGAVYVDCGAYIGDTIMTFLMNNPGPVSKIYAFEPLKSAYDLLSDNVEAIARAAGLDRDRILCVNRGVGESDARIINEPKGGESGVICGNMLYKFETRPLVEGDPENDSAPGDARQVVELVALDHYLRGQPVSIIKADVEGFELDMLKGAAGTIKAHRPKLAICLYHQPRDFFEIPLYIQSLVPEYKMAVRHHAPSAMETVLYCWVD